MPISLDEFSLGMQGGKLKTPNPISDVGPGCIIALSYP